MTTSERIAAAIKHILDEDRRADRERIAELERDAAHLRTEIEQLCRHIKLVETDFAASLEKCAALVVENKRLSGAVQTAIKNAGKDVLLEDKTPAVEVKRTPKVGDSVRIIDQQDLQTYGKAGEIGTVSSLDGDGTAWVAGVGRDGPWCHLLENLEVIE